MCRTLEYIGGTCLRVRVHLDVNKRLVRGKKITVEGGEGKWVNFKYERLPNFCYRCGLLNHTFKDCPENGEERSRTEDEELQYGAWLRGDIIRRALQDHNRASFGREASPDTSQWNDGVETERRNWGGGGSRPKTTKHGGKPADPAKSDRWRSKAGGRSIK